MADEKIKVEIESKYDDSEAKDAITDAEKIEKLDPELQISADNSDAEAKIEEVSDDAKALTREDHKLILQAQFDDAKRALADLDQRLKDLDDSAATTGHKIGDEVSEGSDKAKGAVHGFVGEAAVELPGVGDAVGPAGEAIGQMVEGLVAGEIAMGDLVAAALPLVAMTVVFKLITGYLADMEATKAFNKDQVEDWVTALGEGKSLIKTIKEEMLKTQKIEFMDDGDLKEIDNDLYRLGQTAEDFIDLVTKPDALNAFKDQRDAVQENVEALMRRRTEMQAAFTAEDQAKLDAAKQKLSDYNDVIGAAEQKTKNMSAAEKEAAVNTFVYGDSMKEAKTSTDEAATATDDYAEAQRKAKMKTDQAKAAIDLQTIAIQNLKGELDDEQAVLNFQESMINAQNAIKDNGKLTQQQLIDAKQAIIEIGTTAGLTKVEIETEINKITPTDVNTAFFETQALINQHADLKMKATIQATIDAEIKSHSGAKFGLGPDGVLRPSGTSASGASAPAPPAPAAAPAVTQQFTINVPRGYRELDAAQAAHRVSKRSGRIYARR